MKKINLVKLLRNCPSGMELDCTMFEDIEFDRIVDNDFFPIQCRVKNSNGVYDFYYFTKYGYWNTEYKAKCVIFPKGKTTWEGFVQPGQFKDGDIVVSSLGNIHILKNSTTSYIYVDFTHNANGSLCKSLTTCVRVIRLATEEEKEKLFKVIKDNGCKWNEETKTLEELPKFKVGYKVKQIGSDRCYIIKNIEFDRYILNNNQFIRFGDEHIYELVPVEPQFKVGDRIKWIKTGNILEIIKIIPNCYIANYLGSDITILFDRQDEYELVPVEPQFKVGDRIRTKKNAPITLSNILITKVNEYSYEGVIGDTTNPAHINFKYQDLYELVPVKPKFKVGDTIVDILGKEVGASVTQGVILEITDDKYIFTDSSYMFISSQDNYELVPVEPQFKVGDRIKHKDDKTVITITGIKDNYYLIQFYNLNKNDYQTEKVSFKDQDKYELVPEFKDGDVIVCENHWGPFISIFKENITERNGFIGHCVFDADDNKLKVKDSASYFNKVRFATKGEKELLFKAIKDNGYKWNEETKTLEKLPKFKVGDRVKSKNCPNAGSFIIVGIKEDGYKINIKNCYIKFKDQDNYELQGNYESVSDKFDITSLKTFEQVLVRDFDNTPWEIEFFSRLLDGKHFKCSGLSYMQCIPYKGNEHLNGKKDDCDKYFKTWE